MDDDFEKKKRRSSRRRTSSILHLVGLPRTGRPRTYSTLLQRTGISLDSKYLKTYRLVVAQKPVLAAGVQYMVFFPSSSGF